jgi:hypothetical protein
LPSRLNWTSIESIGVDDVLNIINVVVAGLVGEKNVDTGVSAVKTELADSGVVNVVVISRLVV